MHTHILTGHTLTHTVAYVHTRTHTNTHTQTHTHTLTHTYSDKIQTCTHAPSHNRAPHTHIDRNTRMHTHTHTHIDRHAHTETHRCTQNILACQSVCLEAACQVLAAAAGHRCAALSDVTATAERAARHCCNPAQMLTRTP